MMKASIVTRGGWRLVFAHGFDGVLDFGFERVDLRRMRIRDQAAGDGDALDQLGNCLRQQQREPERDQRFSRPLRQAAGIGGLFVDDERAGKERNTGHDDDDRQRQQKKCVTDDVDRVPQLPWQQIVDDVDANVFVVAQRPRCAEQEHQAEQHPLQFEPGVRGHVERLADDRIDRRDDDRKQDRPRAPFADLHIDGVDDAAQPKKRAHPIPHSLRQPTRPPSPPGAARRHGALTRPMSTSP